MIKNTLTKDRFVTVGEAMSEAIRSFESAQLDSVVEARALLSGLLDISFTDIYLRREMMLTKEQSQLFEQMVSRRLDREPVAYILGWSDFMGRRFSVDWRVLIPRPETELVVSHALGLLREAGYSKPALLDIGTGSGCISLSMALEFPEATVLATDISEDALEVARGNGIAHKVKNINWIQSDLYTSLGREKRGYFDMILSNPPYISTPELDLLEPELSFEPKLALEGGSTGFSVIEKVINGAVPYLKRNGWLILEIGAHQGFFISKRLQEAGFENVQIIKDDSGHDRIAKGKLSGSI